MNVNKFFRRLLLAVIHLSLLQISSAQLPEIEFKCPENWIRYENSCYRYIKSPMRPRADAQRNCIVSIFTEKFILFFTNMFSLYHLI